MSNWNAKEYLLRFNDFGDGMYLRDDQNIKSSHCIECNNVWAPGGISLEKMPGIVLANSSDSIDGPIYGIGLYRSGSADDLIVAGGPATGNKQGKYLYKLSGTSLVRLTDVGGYAFEYTTGGANVEFISYDGVLYIQNGIDKPMKYDGSGLAYWGVPQPSGAPTLDSITGSGGNFTNAVGANDTYGFRIVYYDSVNEQEGEYSAVLAVTATGTTNTINILVTGAELYRGYDKVRVYISAGVADAPAVAALLYSDFYMKTEITMTAQGTVSEDNSHVTGLENLTAGTEYTGITGTVSVPSEYVVTVETVISGTIGAFEDGGTGYTLVDTGTAHGLSNGALVHIVGKTTEYNGDYTIEVSEALGVDHFKIAHAFGTNDQPGTFEKINTFKWAKDGGTVTTGVYMTGAAQTLAEGVTVTFAAKIGHTATDYWTLSVYPWITNPVIACTAKGGSGTILTEEGTNNAPPKAKFMALMDTTIYMAGDPDNLSMLYWTDVDNPLAVPIGNETIPGHWMPLTTDAYGGPITSVQQFAGRVMAMKQDAIWPLIFLADGAINVNEIIPSGTLSHRSVVVCGDGKMRWEGTDDFYEMAQNLEWGQIGMNIEPALKLINNVVKRNCAAGWWRYHYLPGIFNVNSDTAGNMRPYNTMRESWWYWSVNAACFLLVHGDATDTVPDRLYFGSATAGKVYYFDDTVGSYNGSAINTKWVSGAVNPAKTLQDKQFGGMQVKATMVGGFLTIRTGVDNWAFQQIDNVDAEGQPEWDEVEWDEFDWAGSQTKQEILDVDMAMAGQDYHLEITDKGMDEAWKVHEVLVSYTLLEDVRRA